ncbi:MAG TPA: hypothetical protein DCE81_03330 [Cytophagales bacterium]|nr:hypothetical protein [Cytophagales bacterium]
MLKKNKFSKDEHTVARVTLSALVGPSAAGMRRAWYPCASQGYGSEANPGAARKAAQKKNLILLSHFVYASTAARALLRPRYSTAANCDLDGLLYFCRSIWLDVDLARCQSLYAGIGMAGK